MKETIKKLNQNNNFHLSFKVIQINDDSIIDLLIKKINEKVYVIKERYDLYDKLLDAYNNKYKYIVCNETINFLLPLVTIIVKDDVSLIKPTIPVYYYLKDNKIIQKVKTTCNKKMTTYEGFKTIEDLLCKVIEIYF